MGTDVKMQIKSKDEQKILSFNQFFKQQQADILHCQHQIIVKKSFQNINSVQSLEQTHFTCRQKVYALLFILLQVITEKIWYTE